jgi:hypothetical protein
VPQIAKIVAGNGGLTKVLIHTTAADALIDASESYNLPALMKFLGPDGQHPVSSADPVRDKNNATAFAAKDQEECGGHTLQELQGNMMTFCG